MVATCVALMAGGAVLGAVLLPQSPALYAIVGAALGLWVALLSLAQRRIRARWGSVTSWVLLSLCGAALMLLFLPFSSQCRSVASCTREGAVLALLGVLLVVLASLFPLVARTVQIGWSLCVRVRVMLSDLLYGRRGASSRRSPPPARNSRKSSRRSRSSGLGPAE